MPTYALPEELLDKIVSHLPAVRPSDPRNEDLNERTNLRTLHVLSLTSKALYRITGPKLYHTIQLLDFEHDFNRVWCLLRTFLETPKFAGYVQVLQIGPWQVAPEQQLDTTRWQPFAQRLICVVKDTPVLQQAAQYLGQSIPQAMHGALINVILCMCVNLDTLWIDIPRSWSHSLPADMIGRLRSGASYARPLSKLQNLVCTREPKDNSADRINNPLESHINGLSPLLQLLSISSVKSATIHECKLYSDPPIYPRNNIQHLNLERVVLNHHGLARLLATLPRLQSLTLNWSFGGYTRWPQFDCIGDTLELHEPALRSLSIHEARTILRRPAEGQSLPIGSLQQLTTLEELSLSWVMVTGAPAAALAGNEGYLSQMLPLSLRTLELTDVGSDDQEIDNEVHSFMLVLGRYSHLHTIRLHQRAATTYDLEHYGWLVAEKLPSSIVLRKRDASTPLTGSYVQS